MEENEKIQVALLEWIDENAQKKGFKSDRQLAIAADLSASAISKARRGTQKLGYDACSRIAEAMGVSRQLTLTLGGHLEPEPEWTPEITQVVYAFMELPDDKTRKQALDMIRILKK